MREGIEGLVGVFEAEGIESNGCRCSIIVHVYVLTGYSLDKLQCL
jgi:hypothetical protein